VGDILRFYNANYLLQNLARQKALAFGERMDPLSSSADSTVIVQNPRIEQTRDHDPLMNRPKGFFADQFEVFLFVLRKTFPLRVFFFMPVES